MTKEDLNKNFALIGAAGYIAPRHMSAIRNTNNTIIAALDRNDSVGVLDSYFPDAKFFTEFERFDRFIDKFYRSGQSLDFVSICSPNYLHDSHIRFALRSGANAICEKPLVLNPWNLESLKKLEVETGRKIYTILQLRLHPTITKLRKKILSKVTNSKYDVDLTYIAARGNWYQQSWKGDEKKSGGIASNIGVHFFDMLAFIFGEIEESFVHLKTDSYASGYLEFKLARVRWFLSIDYQNIPHKARLAGKRTFRTITINGNELEFSDGFTDLHTQSYKHILSGSGFGVEDNFAAVNLVSEIRRSQVCKKGDQHPLTKDIDS